MNNTTDQAPGETAIERQGRRMLPALERLVLNESVDSPQAGRFSMRIRFALERIADLRERVNTDGGVFEPARLEVAISILETHLVRSANLIVDIIDEHRKQRARAERHAVRAAREARDESPLSAPPARETRAA